MFAKVKELFGSRKFWAGALGGFLALMNTKLGWLNEIQMAQIVALISSWIIGQAIVDAKKPNS